MSKTQEIRYKLFFGSSTHNAKKSQDISFDIQGQSVSYAHSVDGWRSDGVQLVFGRSDSEGNFRVSQNVRDDVLVFWNPYHDARLMVHSYIVGMLRLAQASKHGVILKRGRRHVG